MRRALRKSSMAPENAPGPPDRPEAPFSFGLVEQGYGRLQSFDVGYEITQGLDALGLAQVDNQAFFQVAD